MSKQQVSRIKNVLTILLAVSFTVSLASAATSNVNDYRYVFKDIILFYFSENFTSVFF